MASPARSLLTSASSSASPTIGRTPRSRGHFNDFLFVSLLRAATLAAVRKEGTEGLAEEDFGRRVQQALGFTASNQGRRQEWMLDPEARGPGLIDAERTLSRVIAHRVWVDQRRGWRFTNPRALGRVPWGGVGAVGKWPAAATVTSLAATGHLSTAVVIVDLR